MTHEIVQTEHGLQLLIEHSPMALIRERDGKTDLIWQIRGPQDLDLARRCLAGLIDLVVTWDSQLHPKSSTRKSRKD